MTSSNPIISTIILIFGIQAIVLIVLIFRKRPIKQSSIFLALVVFFFALMCINIAWLNFLITYNKTYLYGYIQLELIFGIGPSLYFFTKSITNPDYRFSRKEFIHFVPLIIEFIYFRTSIYRVGLFHRFEIYQTGSQNIYQSPVHPYTLVYLILQWAGNISFLIYIFYSLNLFAKHRKWVKTNFSNLKNKTLGWLQIPILFYSCFWILWNVLRNIDAFLFQGSFKSFYFLPSFIGVSIATCWLGFKGYIKTEANVTGFSNNKIKTDTRPAKPDEAKKILMTMETQKPFLDPNLNLQKLSEITNIPPKSISGIINQDFKTNFYEFINRYRIEEFKQKLQMESSDKITLIAHAYESGFNSKSTFNHVFKKNTGLTPSEYYNQCKNMSEWKQADF